MADGNGDSRPGLNYSFANLLALRLNGQRLNLLYSRNANGSIWFEVGTAVLQPECKRQRGFYPKLGRLLFCFQLGTHSMALSGTAFREIS